MFLVSRAPIHARRGAGSVWCSVARYRDCRSRTYVVADWSSVPVPPPHQPNYSELRQAEDRRKYAEEQHRLRKREEEGRRKAVDAENRRKNPPGQQK